MKLGNTDGLKIAGRAPVKISKADTLGFAYGVSSLAFVQIYGQLYVSELIAICVVMIVGPKTVVEPELVFVGVASLIVSFSDILVPPQICGLT